MNLTINRKSWHYKVQCFGHFMMTKFVGNDNLTKDVNNTCVYARRAFIYSWLIPLLNAMVYALMFYAVIVFPATLVGYGTFLGFVLMVAAAIFAIGCVMYGFDKSGDGVRYIKRSVRGNETLMNAGSSGWEVLVSFCKAIKARICPLLTYVDDERKDDE